MKHLLFLAFILAIPVCVRCEKGPVAGREEVAYSVDLSRVKAQPTPLPESPYQIIGRGRILAAWRLIKLSEHVYELSGTVHDDNVYHPAQGAAVLVGNIETNDMLRLVARTDPKGQFKVRIDNRTYDQRMQAAMAEASTKKYIVVARNDSKYADTQETIYLKEKYLYLGQNNVNLFRYEIPYAQAEQNVAETTSEPEMNATP